MRTGLKQASVPFTLRSESRRGRPVGVPPRACYPTDYGGGMPTAKEAVRKLLDELPEEASYEDIQYYIYVREKIEKGLRDVRDGRVLTEEEFEQRAAKWFAD